MDYDNLALSQIGIQCFPQLSHKKLQTKQSKYYKYETTDQFNYNYCECKCIMNKYRTQNNRSVFIRQTFVLGGQRTLHFWYRSKAYKLLDPEASRCRELTLCLIIILFT